MVENAGATEERVGTDNDRQEPVGKPPRRPDQHRELLLEESTANELTIALWRLVFCLVAAVQVVLQVAFDANVDYNDWVTLGCIFGGVFYSAILFVVISRFGYSPLLSFTSVTLDISLITGGLFGVAISGEPMFATNNVFSVPLYILAIALAGLRYSPRLTVFATVLAMTEYSLLVWFAMRFGDLYNLTDPEIQKQIFAYGQFDLVMQLTRLVLIGSGGVVSTFGVRRARELRTASILDALTQVYNRGFFDERFHHEFSRAERYERSLAIAMFDVDHFKLYNDRLGHIAGDQVLREVADIFRIAVRATDIVARYGGEEFVVLLPETNKEQAVGLVDRLRQQVEAHSFLGAEGQPRGALTISAGVAAFPDDASTPQTLFHRADEALYLAKGAGRNRVVAWSPPEAATEDGADPRADAPPQG